MLSGAVSGVNVEGLAAGAGAVVDILEVSLGQEHQVVVCALSDVYEVWGYVGGDAVEVPFAVADVLFNFRQMCAEQGVPWLRAEIDVRSPDMWSARFFFDGPLPWFLPEDVCVEWLRVDVEEFPRSEALVGGWVAGLLGVAAGAGAATVNVRGGFSRNSAVFVSWEK